MSIHECDGCGELRDVTHGKCVDCWRVEAVYLRTNIAAVAEILRVGGDKRDRQTVKVLSGALKPIPRDGYIRGRGCAVDDDGCGVER